MDKTDNTETDEEAMRHLQETLDRNRTVLKAGAATPATQSWLKPRLNTPEGTQQVYEAMEREVSSPGFLAKLIQAFSKQKVAASPQKQASGSEVMQPEFWEDVTVETSLTTAGSLPEHSGFEQISAKEAEIPAEDLQSYVVVNKEDALDAMGTFVAAYLAELPEAANMQPAELQNAIKHAFKELKQSRMRRLWGWGRAIYRCVAFSYGAFSVYENPWLVRAILTAMWTASKMMLGLLI